MLDIASTFLVVTALLAYFNHRFIGLPTSIGVMVAALSLSLLLVGLDSLGLLGVLKSHETALLHSVDFSKLLMQGMLSLLLFAGALHVDLSELRSYRWQIGTLAIFGTLLSTVVIGAVMWWVLPWIGVFLPLIDCLLFGALISPTDPIAVMGILKTAGVPKNLGLVIAGESLFNDGVAVVIFALLLGIAADGQTPTIGQGTLLLLHEAGGGLLFGLVLGYISFRLLRSIDQYQVEVLITLAAVMGGYALAQKLGVSGPLAMVVAGVMLGNYGRANAMSDTTRHHVDLFWELIDEILNAVLFVLIGMEVIVIRFPAGITLAALVAILVTLLVRALTVGLPVALGRKLLRLPAGTWKVLTWGGLRGGISVALALSLPQGPAREFLLALTYCVVVASILGQGLSIGRVARHAVRSR